MKDRQQEFSALLKSGLIALRRWWHWLVALPLLLLLLWEWQHPSLLPLNRMESLQDLWATQVVPEQAALPAPLPPHWEHPQPASAAEFPSEAFTHPVWSLRLGEIRVDIAHAQQDVKHLRAAGYHPFIRRQYTDDIAMYSVHLGPWLSLEAAQKRRLQLQKQKVLKYQPVDIVRYLPASALATGRQIGEP